MIRYYSTNRSAPPVGLEEALLNGLAPDGGLYYPEKIPQFTAEELAHLHQRARVADGDSRELLQESGAVLLQKWFGEEIESALLRTIAAEALSFPIPIRQVADFLVLELFHGPTMAFKDIAARTLARLLNHFLTKRGEQALLLVATSGDTGGAIANGFAGQEAIRVVVLFPKGKVSELQEEQLTRVASNVTPVEVDGVFDDCQALVKWAFTHAPLQPLNLTSANSINIARLIPQIVYYLYAALLVNRQDMEVVVPSGNFGNLTAGLFAREMGVNLPYFIAATNENDAGVRYHQSGHYNPHPTVQTLSTAMDVGNPSNFVRILELFEHTHERLRVGLRAFKANDGETIEVMQRVYQEHGYLLCPHSAVGWAVAERHGRPDSQPLVVATASPLKFAREIEAHAGIPVDDSVPLAHLRKLPKRKIALPNRPEALADLLLHL
ncbi:MAG: threonine synthase [Ardenticatenales bacterium]|nr:threonine synthase [Ardenticatenales bacterium]